MEYMVINDSGIIENIISASENFTSDLKIVPFVFPYSIGDRYIEHVAPEIDEGALIKAQLQATIDRQEFLEDCIAEMAEIIYA